MGKKQSRNAPTAMVKQSTSPAAKTDVTFKFCNADGACASARGSAKTMIGLAVIVAAGAVALAAITRA